MKQEENTASFWIAIVNLILRLNLNLVIYFMKNKQFIRLKQVLKKNLKEIITELILMKMFLE